MNKIGRSVYVQYTPTTCKITACFFGETLETTFTAANNDNVISLRKVNEFTCLFNSVPWIQLHLLRVLSQIRALQRC